MTVAKGITSAYMPLSACLVSDAGVGRDRAAARTRTACSATATPTRPHPLAAAAAMTNLDIIERDGLMQQAKARGDHLHARLRRRVRRPPAGRRGPGLRTARRRRVRRQSKPAHRLRSAGQLSRARGRAGARARGDHAGRCPPPTRSSFSPPFVVTEDELDQMVATDPAGPRRRLRRAASAVVTGAPAGPCGQPDRRHGRPGRTARHRRRRARLRPRTGCRAGHRSPRGAGLGQAADSAGPRNSPC